MMQFSTSSGFASSLLKTILVIAFVLMILYYIYMKNLNSRECTYMSQLYPTINGYIRPITESDADCKYKLFDYYIKTAYNACSGGSYKNDYVNVCNLKSVISQGVRCLDFEIFSLNNNPIVSTSTTNNFFVKETYNYVDFVTVMEIIKNYAFASGTCPNPTDPLCIHLRIKSTNTGIYKKMADIFKKYDSLMLGKEYSFENSGNNLGSVPLLSLQNKIIIIVDKMNNTFMESQDFLEYVNLTSNSLFMRAYTFDNIKNNPDINELTEYNKRGMTIVFPNNGINPENPSALLCRELGCQMVAMRYQYVDNFLEENAVFFDRGTYAFVLKPEKLRYQEVTIPDPTPQNPELSYETREKKTDYYSFKY